MLIHKSLKNKKSHAKIRKVIPGTQDQAVGRDKQETDKQPRLPQT